MFKFSETGGLFILLPNEFKVYIKYPLNYNELNKQGNVAEQIYSLKSSVNNPTELLQIEIKDPFDKDVTSNVTDTDMIKSNQLGGILTIVQNLKR